MKIVLECNADEQLALSLGVSPGDIIHAGSKSKVGDRLIDGLSMKGMVDEDPASRQPLYFRRLTGGEKHHGIRLLHDGNRSHHIAMLCPRLEGWVLQICRQARLDIGRFNLPDKDKDLHKIINDRLSNLDRVIRQLLAGRNPAVIHLQSLLLSEYKQ